MSEKIKVKTRELVFTFEWAIEISQNMSMNLDEVMDKMREMGSCDLVDCKVREAKS